MPRGIGATGKIRSVSDGIERGAATGEAERVARRAERLEGSVIGERGWGPASVKE